MFGRTYAQTSFVGLGGNTVKPSVLESTVRATPAISAQLDRVRCDNPGGATTPETENSTGRTWMFVFRGVGPLSAPEIAALDAIVAAHDGVEPVTSSGGVTETSGPTALTWGDIPDGSLIGRSGTELRAAIDVARVRQFAATARLDLTSTSAATALTFVTIPIVAGRKYYIEGVVLIRTFVTTIGPNIVVDLSGGAAISGLICTSWFMQSGTASRASWVVATNAAPSNVNNSSASSANNQPVTISASFTCTASGNLLLEVYKGFSTNGTMDLVSGTITAFEVIFD